MSKHGENKKLKRLNTPKRVPVKDKKNYVFLTKPMPGAHNVKNSITLVSILRDILKLAKNSKEVKKILFNKDVLVDLKIRKKPKFSVGLMDLISIPKTNKHYLVLIKKGELYLKEINKTTQKTCKVIKKTTLKNNQIALGTHDGRTILADNNIKIGDSLIYDLFTKKIVKHLKLEIGANCLIVEGKHAGAFGKLVNIVKTKKINEAQIELENKEKITTLTKYLFVTWRDLNE